MLIRVRISPNFLNMRTKQIDAGQPRRRWYCKVWAEWDGRDANKHRIEVKRGILDKMKLEAQRMQDELEQAQAALLEVNAEVGQFLGLVNGEEERGSVAAFLYFSQFLIYEQSNKMPCSVSWCLCRRRGTPWTRPAMRSPSWRSTSVRWDTKNRKTIFTPNDGSRSEGFSTFLRNAAAFFDVNKM